MRFALVSLLVLAGAVPQDDVKKVVSDADKVKKLSRKISKEARDKIEKALGEKLEDKDLTPVLYECLSTVPILSSAEKTRCTVCIVSVKGPKGVVRIGVAAATGDNVLHAVKLLENGDDKALEAKLFMSQFEDLEYSANLYNAPDVLTQMLKKAAAPKDDAEKEIATLFKMNTLMRGVGPHWARLLDRIDKQDKTAADEIAPMDKSFEEAMALVSSAPFLKATQHDKFKQYAAGARTDLTEVKSLLAAGKFDDAFRKTGELDSARCAKCHGSYQRRFRDRRFECNLGNGYFSTRLDVVVPDPGLEPAYQSVATGIRKAILLAAEAK